MKGIAAFYSQDPEDDDEIKDMIEESAKPGLYAKSRLLNETESMNQSRRGSQINLAPLESGRTY